MIELTEAEHYAIEYLVDYGEFSDQEDREILRAMLERITSPGGGIRRSRETYGSSGATADSHEEYTKMTAQFALYLVEEFVPAFKAFLDGREGIEARLRALGIHYGGRGPSGEDYTKYVGGWAANTIWTEGDTRWTPEELEAIAAHKRSLGRKGP